VHPSALADHLKQRYGTVIAAGQGPLSKGVFRIGHLGYVSAADVVAGLGALEAALADLTGSVVSGAGVAAAVDIYRSAATWPQRPPLGPEHYEE
jgi:aspartate aminotransferase-like enzyme